MERPPLHSFAMPLKIGETERGAKELSDFWTKLSDNTAT